MRWMGRSRAAQETLAETSASEPDRDTSAIATDSADAADAEDPSTEADLDSTPEPVAEEPSAERSGRAGAAVRRFWSHPLGSRRLGSGRSGARRSGARRFGARRFGARRFGAWGNARSVGWGAGAGVGAVLAGGLLSAALAVVAWSLNHAPGQTSWDAVRLGLQGWFLAHGVRIDVPWGVMSLAPLALSALFLYFLYRAGRQVARAADVRSLAGAAEATVAVLVGYVVAAMLLTELASTPSAGVQPGWTALRTAIFAMIGAGLGVAVETGLGHRLVSALPGPGYAYLRAGVAGAIALFGAAALAVSVSLLLHAGLLGGLIEAITPDSLGGWVVLMLALLYLPNAAVYGIAMSTGAGFTLGSQTAVSLTAVSHGPLPAFPLLAALPEGPGGDLLTWLGGLGPVAAGVAAALVLVRSLDVDERRLGPVMIAIAGMSVVSGLLTGGVTLLASGALGEARLAQVGAVGWQVAAATAACIAVAGGLSTAIVLTRQLTTGAPVRRRSRPAALTAVAAAAAVAKDPEELVADDLQIGADTGDPPGKTDDSDLPAAV